MTKEKEETLRIERLLLIQHYKGFILVECRCCKQLIVFPDTEDDLTWSCEKCDRKRIFTAGIPPKKRVHHERKNARYHRRISCAA